MSLHINAQAGQIASTVLLAGDPLRAKFVADEMLEKVECYNEVRGMLGYTGWYQGKRVSVQGTGMGQASLGIYVHELLYEYEVKRLIRIGSCGAMQADIQLRDVLLAQAASTDSSMNQARFNGSDYAACSTFSLLLKAWEAANQMNIPVRVGNILSTDVFYQDDQEAWKLWAEYGVLAVEMESAALFTLAAKAQAEVLSILTVSDSLVTAESLAAEDRERSFREMVEIALAVS